MSKIITLFPTEDIPVQESIWECRCGTQTFYLHQDQSVECSNCGTFSTNIKTFYDDDHGGPSKGPLDKQ
jgi:hypothetical protein